MNYLNCTQKKEGFIDVSPAVLALSQELIHAQQDPLAVVDSVWDGLMDWVRIGRIHYHEIDTLHPVDSVITIRWCDCYLGSALLVSLCRAAMIPARLVSGYVLYTKSPFYHYWAEAWIEGVGWVPYDLLAWELSAGGRHERWKSCFRGQVDYRMRTQLLPKIFTGSLDLKLPVQWCLQTQFSDDWFRTSYYDMGSRQSIYFDEIKVDCLDKSS
jgi:hypothetical protein